MKTFFKWLLLLPVALAALVFAVANRHSTTVVLDPLGLLTSGMTISAPLFIILFLAMMVGVVLGGIASWIAQGKHRRAAREAMADLRIMREESRAQTEEVIRLRSELATLPPPVETRNAA
jgi:uncharacterized integral membrane protein